MVTIANSRSLPVITTLRADLVPHREMAIRKWYIGSSKWYYHRRALPGEFDYSRRFYQLIDPQLRRLCRMLHQHGIHTTPSCQGHFFGRDHFERLWGELEHEEQLIRTTGLPVRDSGSGTRFLFRAHTFELPWPNFAAFHSQAAAAQSQGYLGLLLPRHQHAIVCELHNHPFHMPRAWIRFDGELSCLLGASAFGIFVQPQDPTDRDHMWETISEYLHMVIEAAKTPPLWIHNRTAVQRIQ